MCGYDGVERCAADVAGCAGSTSLLESALSIKEGLVYAKILGAIAWIVLMLD
jgi:hypothetical protein